MSPRSVWVGSSGSGLSCCSVVKRSGVAGATGFLGESEKITFSWMKVIEYKLLASGRMIRAHDSLIRMVSTIRKEQGRNGKGVASK